ncbi:FAD/NAD(P)-binding domain-containing protein [Corynespora cassiicola Philippines]|uniref:FAD/NAD(P)-binding domain-containing protein n=1 Tax=Corynespora cassiicola Philippines TaxID=1448308 RepID=A0A2T2NTW5_CORCC|nr:FAD/NAD(P)-binding domain-containing protein [Corynespora cassiicola Philippines]
MTSTSVDALIVGAGYAGIYATYRLSRAGFNIQCIERGSDVGGTWYWNRYPGAMSDTESYLYRFSWDKEDLQTYPWTHHYVYQPEILEYLRHVTDRHDLRKHMRFDTEMKAAVWDEGLKRWRITCSTGEVFLARYFVNALGILVKPNYPDIVGIDTFQGDIVHTATWVDEIKMEGKKVGIIGSGSTGVQVMTAIAPIVGHLTSFQRRPQYSVPSGQGPVSAEYRENINKNYDQIWRDAFDSMLGFGVPESRVQTMSVSSEERKRVFQEAWDKGNGFRFMFSTFGDIVTNEEANKEACKFIHEKIDETVKDPSKAEILKPKDLYARRPLCDHGYYEIFNRDNVDVVDLQATPIKAIVPDGVQLQDGTVHELDVLILATGFDSVEGSFNRVSIKGRNGTTLQEHWKDGPTAYGGIACAGFPNMFIISGPQGPFANFPPVIECESNFIFSCLEHIEANRAGGETLIFEAKAEAERGWVELCEKLASPSLFRKTASWITGVNVTGRKSTINFYFPGLKSYLKWVDEIKKGGFTGFELSPSLQPQSKL